MLDDSAGAAVTEAERETATIGIAWQVMDLIRMAGRA
jgi:hypothetical protein